MSTKYLDKAIKILSEEQNLDYDDLGSLESKLVNIEDEVFDSFNLAILSGEFCRNPEFEEKSDKLLDLLGSSDIFNLPYDREEDQDFLKLLKNNFLEPLNLGVKILKDLSRVLRHTLDINNRVYHGYFDEDVVKYLTDDTFDENSRINIQFLGINANVAIIDIKLNSSQEQFQQLINFTKQIDNTKYTKPYKQILIEKCNFLIAKLSLGLNLSNSNKSIGLIPYVVIDTKESEINEEFFFKTLPEWAKQDFDYILNHEEQKNDWRYYITKNFNEIKNRKISNLTIREIHLAIKYYKDILPSIDILEEICLELDNRLQIAKDSNDNLDIHALRTCLAYAVNNRFSLFLYQTKLEEAGFSKIEEEYKVAFDYNIHNDIYNYFPEFRLTAYLVNEYEGILSKERDFNKDSLLLKIDFLCRRVNDTYEKHIERSKNKDSLIFQLPYNECLYPCKSLVEDFEDVFIYSSFLVPIPSSKYEEDYHRNRSKIITINSTASIINNITEKINTIQSVAQQLKDKEFKVLEMLGIFTALITFIFSGVKSYEFISTPLESLFFMLSLSTSLCFFVLLIITVFRGVDHIKKYSFFFSIFGIFTVLFWSFMLIIFSGKEANKKEKAKKEVELEIGK